VPVSDGAPVSGAGPPPVRGRRRIHARAASPVEPHRRHAGARDAGLPVRTPPVVHAGPGREIKTAREACQSAQEGRKTQHAARGPGGGTARSRESG
jgi:hypothetical protein